VERRASFACDAGATETIFMKPERTDKPYLIGTTVAMCLAIAGLPMEQYFAEWRSQAMAVRGLASMLSLTLA
jgi:hypothetical protein